MLQITNEFKQKVVAALLEVRQNFSGSDTAFAKQWSMNNSVYSRIKNGVDLTGLLKDMQWLNIGRELGVSLNERKWNMARTDVYDTISRDVEFCQLHSKAMMCVDEPAIGKTYSAKYLSRTLKNCFYVDGSQAKTKTKLVRAIARSLGLEHQSSHDVVKENVKYYLKMLPNPVVIIDEAGDLDYESFLELKELYNATERACGWYMMGAVGLRTKISNGIRNEKPGFAELFSRYADNYTTIVPVGTQERTDFYKKLISDVLSVNMEDKTKLPEILKRSLVQNSDNRIVGLRRAEGLLILNS